MYVHSSFIPNVKVTQFCLTLCDPTDYSLPGSSLHGILQARILDWGAISFTRGSSWIRDWTSVFCIGRWALYHWATMSHQGSLVPSPMVEATQVFTDGWMDQQNVVYNGRASLVAQLAKNLPAMWETWVWDLGLILGWEDSLEKGKATHSSILAWRIPWTV